MIDGETIRDLDELWAFNGWRSNEYAALRFSRLDFDRQVVAVTHGRTPRMGGLESRPKNDERAVDLAYAPVLFEMFARRRAAAISEYVFADSLGKPLNQEQLAKRVWNPTLRGIGLKHRGQYVLRHTAASNMLDAGETPEFVSRVLGTSEQMIWMHYRHHIKGARSNAGEQFYGRMTRRAVSAEPARRPLTREKSRERNGGGGN